MNVIVANKFKDELSNLDIDVIKRLDGEFDVDTIVDTFSNFFFNRMVLDITALKDPFNISNIQKISASLDAQKIILMLDDDPRISNSFLSKIISLGIYNFSRDIAGISYLMENPNSYRDVAQYHDLAANDQENLKSSSKASGFGGFAPNMGGTVQNMTQSVWPNMSAPQNDNNSSGSSFNQTANPVMAGPRVIGFRDLTPDAGATTLVYMLKKNLSSRKVLAVEVNNSDFTYFGDNELVSIAYNNFGTVKSKFSQFDIILVDLNNSNLDTDGTCTDVIYLLEPSTIKLNSLMKKDRQAFDKIKDKKLVLNKSLLEVNDVKEFEYEAKVKVFYNIPPLDERKDSWMVLDSFLERLGIFTNNENSGNKGLFNIFRK